ncbi:MAG: signal peptidase II [Beutenbergiaceae bacterium]
MSDDTNTHATTSSRRLVQLLALVAAVVLIADQVTKWVALENLQPSAYTPVLGDLFGLTLVRNPGAAFSFASGSTWIFTIVAVIVTIVIIRTAPRLRSTAWALSLGALLGGNLGNLGDRLLREPGFGVGHVVDFLNYGGIVVGNVADIAIVFAAASMAMLAFRGIGIDGIRTSAQGADVDAERTEPSTEATDPGTESLASGTESTDADED